MILLLTKHYSGDNIKNHLKGIGCVTSGAEQKFIQRVVGEI